MKTSKAVKPAGAYKTATGSNRHSLAVHLKPEDNFRLTNLCGQFDQHLRQIEKHFDVEISNRGFQFKILGLPLPAQKTINLLQELYDITAVSYTHLTLPTKRIV